MSSKSKIKLSGHEVQSGYSRVRHAEGLIKQLPSTHDGRNTWLLNYGVGEEAQKLRASDAEKRIAQGYSPRELIWDNKTDCLKSV